MSNTANSGTVRLPHRGHFSFLRALLQGVDAKMSWDAYLLLESSKIDDQMIRKTADWIRAECATAARRDGKYHVARLLRIDFVVRDEMGKAIHSGAPITELSQAGSPQVQSAANVANARKRSCLVQRQLEALQSLETQMMGVMSAEDAVDRWFPWGIAKRFEKKDLPTLLALAVSINANGKNWWKKIPHVGKKKAGWIAEWVRMHQQDIDIKISWQRDPKLDDAARSTYDVPSTSLAPLEHFLVPQDLDGHDGKFRTMPGECLLDAENDRQAIDTWLSSKPPSFTSYRKEVERLLLWAILVRQKPLSSLTYEDAEAFRIFLMNPPEHWCGHRSNRRDSSDWRPMEAGLSPSSLMQALSILRALFTYLTTHRYVYGHPFLGVLTPESARVVPGRRGTLTFEQWDFISRDLVAELQANGHNELTRRRARAIRWLYATGLSLSEMVAVECGALRLTQFRSPCGKLDSRWMLKVVGQRQILREVAVPQQLIAELEHELARAGRPRTPTAKVNARVPVLAQFSAAEGGTPPAWSSSGLYRAVKVYMEACASRMNDVDAARVRCATPRWLRNTHGLHAASEREDTESGQVALQHVAADMECRSQELISCSMPPPLEPRRRIME